MSKWSLAFLCSLAAYAASAQQPTRDVPVYNRAQLATVCGGLWTEVNAAIDNLKRLDLSTEKEKQRASCLLDVLAATQFDARDRGYNELFFKLELKSLVHVYNVASYDFFASEMRARTGRTHDALRGVLMAAGHPDAFRDYFAERRVATEKAQAPGAARFWSPFVEEGKCLDAACSTRLPETIGVIRANLGLVARNLEASSNAAPLDTTPKVQNERQEDERLLTVVRRVERGEATIGRIR